jgi:hypothetical protein
MGKITKEEKAGLMVLSVLFAFAYPFVWVYRTVTSIFSSDSEREHNENNHQANDDIPKP